MTANTSNRAGLFRCRRGLRAAGVAGLMAATSAVLILAGTSPALARDCHGNGTNACATPTPTPAPSPSATPKSSPTPAATATPKSGGTGLTSDPTAAPKSGGTGLTSDPTAAPKSSGTKTGGSSPAGTGSGATTSSGLPHDNADPSPFAPLSSVAAASAVPVNLDSARIPPIEALSPLSGLSFGSGLQVGPLLLLVDLLGIAGLYYFVRRRWLVPVD